MLRIKVETSWKNLFLVFVFYALLLENPISSVIPAFKYMDELFPFLGIAILLYRTLCNGKLKIKKTSLGIVLALAVFSLSGFMGNLLYEYQPISIALKDFWVNLKFFLSILSGYLLFCVWEPEQQSSVIVKHAKFAVVVLFSFLLLDLVFQIFPVMDYRYGLRAEQLIFGHSTYLAGAAVFLVAVLTAFYEKSHNKYILMGLILQVFTLRGKAIAGAVVYIIVFFFVLQKRKKLKLWHIVLVCIAALWIGWEQISFYYVDLDGQSARSVLTTTSLEILKDYFPIGTGFGTYASSSAGEFYSPVYVKYGFLDIYELDGVGTDFFDDTFWPIIIGQTGAIGTLSYLAAIVLLLKKVLEKRKLNNYAYAAGIYMFAYLLISSTSEPAFNNSIAIPIAMMFGCIFKQNGRKTG